MKKVWLVVVIMCGALVLVGVWYFIFLQHPLLVSNTNSYPNKNSTTTSITAQSNGYCVIYGNCWQDKAPMPTARWGLVAVSDYNLVYALGGSPNNESALSTVEAYDPSTNTWATEAPMPAEAQSFDAVSLGGQIYAFGVGDGGKGTAIYDPRTNSWKTGTPMPSYRSYFTAATLDAYIYIIGGYDSNGNPNLSTEVYNTETNSWSTKAPMPFSNTFPDLFGATEVNGLLYVFGDYSGALEAYNPATNAWEMTTNGTTPPNNFDSPILKAFNVNGLVYVLEENGEVVSYNSATNSWLNLVPYSKNGPQQGILSDSAATMSGNAIYVLGGATNNDTPAQFNVAYYLPSR
ncbi:MAG: hypothetical protein M1153_01990 [Patescibacteria group bacterium]|nr:hypothetical protein [Patescibacteria group bacterium]